MDSVNLHFERHRQELADAARDSVAAELYKALVGLERTAGIDGRDNLCWCDISRHPTHAPWCLMARKAFGRYEKEHGK
jgi:hypothetical protein